MSTTTTGAPGTAPCLPCDPHLGGSGMPAEHTEPPILLQAVHHHESLAQRFSQCSNAEPASTSYPVRPCALGLMFSGARRAFYAMNTADQWLSLALDGIGALLSFLVSMLVVGLKGQLGASKSALVLERVRPRQCALQVCIDMVHPKHSC